MPKASPHGINQSPAPAKCFQATRFRGSNCHQIVSTLEAVNHVCRIHPHHPNEYVWITSNVRQSDAECSRVMGTQLIVAGYLDSGFPYSKNTRLLENTYTYRLVSQPSRVAPRHECDDPRSTGRWPNGPDTASSPASFLSRDAWRWIHLSAGQRPIQTFSMEARSSSASWIWAIAVPRNMVDEAAGSHCRPSLLCVSAIRFRQLLLVLTPPAPARNLALCD